MTECKLKLFNIYLHLSSFVEIVVLIFHLVGFIRLRDAVSFWAARVGCLGRLLGCV